MTVFTADLFAGEEYRTFIMFNFGNLMLFGSIIVYLISCFGLCSSKEGLPAKKFKKAEQVCNYNTSVVFLQISVAFQAVCV